MHPRNPGLADELYNSNPCIKNGASQEIYLKDIPEIKIVAFFGKVILMSEIIWLFANNSK
jgi:hypothetical protein